MDSGQQASQGVHMKMPGNAPVKDAAEEWMRGQWSSFSGLAVSVGRCFLPHAAVPALYTALVRSSPLGAHVRLADVLCRVSWYSSRSTDDEVTWRNFAGV